MIVDFETAQLLKNNGFHKPTQLFYTSNGVISNEFYSIEYSKNKIQKADWNAYPQNPNAKPWYKYGYSAPNLDVVINWINEKMDKIVKSEDEIKLLLKKM